MSRSPAPLSGPRTCTGGVVRLRTGEAHLAMVTDPGLVRTLLHHVTGPDLWAGHVPLPGPPPWSADDGPRPDEDSHPEDEPCAGRASVAPNLRREVLRRHSGHAVRLARGYAGTLRDGRRIDLFQEMSSLALDLLQAGVFGSRPGDVPAPARRSQALLGALLPCLSRAGGPLRSSGQTRLRRRITREIAVLDAEVSARLEAHRTGHAQDDGVMPLILAARNRRTGVPLPDRVRREEVLTLLLAGHETVTTALTWSWYELARSAPAAALLTDELRRPTARRTLHEGSWRELPVCRAVVAETLRLHPPALFLSRRATRTFALGPEVIRRGTLCIVSPYGLHRDPRSWNDPLSWRPERWLDGRGRFDPTAPGHPRGAYLPFGVRPRICTAQTLVAVQSTLALAVLASIFRVQVAGWPLGETSRGLSRCSRGRFPAVLQRRGALRPPGGAPTTSGRTASPPAGR
jgi:cytochrome P450